MSRPFGDRGSSAGRKAAGCAAFTAASNRSRRKSRADPCICALAIAARALARHVLAHYLVSKQQEDCAMDERTRTELGAAVYRRLVEHLRARTDVQNIDLMNLAGFCRNCLSNWMKGEADGKGVGISKDESREAVYGMPYETWKSKFQGAASSEQKAAFEKSRSGHS